MIASTNQIPFKNSLEEFTYTLFYPSLLGSMIFQIISEVFKCEDFIIRINELLILFIYILDWFFIKYYLSRELDKMKNNQTKYHILDILIPLFYTLSFFSIRVSQTWIPCLSLVIALGLIDYYIWSMKKVRFLFILMTVISIIFFLINFFELTDKILFMNILLVVIYFLIVRISYKEKKSEIIKNAA
jgi:hypothetical protein